jgi:hypothetical protein
MLLPVSPSASSAEEIAREIDCAVRELTTGAFRECADYPAQDTTANWNR